MHNDNKLFSFKILVLLFSFLSLFFSCKFDSIPVSSNQNETLNTFEIESLSVDELYELINGRWNWNYSKIMQRNIHPPDNKITPESIGYTIQREFKSNKQVDYYKNNEYISTYSYEIKRFKILPTDKEEKTLIYIDGYASDLRFLNPDIMMIGSGSGDGINSYYVRIK